MINGDGIDDGISSDPPGGKVLEIVFNDTLPLMALSATTVTVDAAAEVLFGKSVDVNF
jgi:hypothetical protein